LAKHFAIKIVIMLYVVRPCGGSPVGTNNN
jgi:hypothetical protein